jgi:hypothetical protein
VALAAVPLVNSAAVSHLFAPILFTPSNNPHHAAIETIIGVARFNIRTLALRLNSVLLFFLGNGCSGTFTSRNLCHNPWSKYDKKLWCDSKLIQADTLKLHELALIDTAWNVHVVKKGQQPFHREIRAAAA